MIDHVLGRPSIQFRKIQVLAVVSFWSLYLVKGNRHGPPTIRKVSRYLSKSLSPFQTLAITLLYLYVARNFAPLFNLECPEPLANLYTRSYFRATWITTALDAGFWTAMRIRRKWLRDILSVVFSGYYLIAAEQADEKVRKVRGSLTLDHLRVSWNKGTTPYLGFITALGRPRFMKYPPREIRIPRPQNSDYTDPVHAWLYFDGPISALKNHTKIVLDIPGGGFVAMDPRTNDDKLFAWAGKTGLPVLSLNYKKAPEFPYPYALNECFDVYQTIVASRGRCVGLSGEVVPKIVVTGDSAGGNLATGTVLMIVESGSTDTRQYQGQPALPRPEGLVLIYPGLDMNIGNWMSDEQMSLIQDRKMRNMNRRMLRQKSMQYTHIAGTPHPSDNEAEDVPSSSKAVTEPATISVHNSKGKGHNPASPQPSASTATENTITNPSIPPPSIRTPTPAPHHIRRPSSSHKPQPLQTRLAMSSMISYFNDRILTPEMMRAMIILYIGPHNRPDFSTDYLLSPVLAPDTLLARFPKVYFLTGERDPLVDDTVIFAGRLRRAKQWAHERSGSSKELLESDICEVNLIPGISHGFLQFAGAFPEGWNHIHRCSRWIMEIFEQSAVRDSQSFLNTPGMHPYTETRAFGSGFSARSRANSSGEEDLGLEMSMTKAKGGAADSTVERQRERTRRRKERLLREEMDERRILGGQHTREKKGLQRKKSLVALASEEGLLGRRMLGLAGPLTGVGDDGSKGS